MITIPGLNNVELLFENEYSLTCRGTDRTHKTPLVYKILKKEYLSTPFSNSLQREFEIGCSIKSDKIIEMLDYLIIDGAPAILMEDFDGYPLLELPSFDKYSPEKLLRLAILITSALEDIHRENVVYCNLTPHHILYNPMTRQLRLADFTLAQSLLTTKPGSFSLPIPEKSLPYISPEQTGRLNRVIDHRSDYYSLGVCLYQVFSGLLPFSATETAEYIHLHIAKDAFPPHVVNRSVPRLVSKIIVKLLNKTPDDRYQSCRGILHDLNLCLHSFRESGVIVNFALGEKDIPEIFKISEKLYGREQEIAIILSEFDSIQRGDSKILFITGDSGTGKSSLVDSLREPVASHHGYFLSGKFNQAPSNSPYSPIISAFKGLVNHILAGDETTVQIWKNRILSFIGDRGKIIIDVIPEVELIIGKQPPLPELPPLQNENRFSWTLSTFIHSCSSNDRPLVLFLDDMQWADATTLRFVEHFLVRQKTDGILILGTYKSNEVQSAHPLNLTITTIQQSGPEVTTIKLPSLCAEDIEGLLADTLFETREKVSALAAICLEKTDGNPFFLKQFLQAAHQETHITYNSDKGIWLWDERAISLMEVTDNLLHLQLENLKSLESNTLVALKFAACLGNRFDLTTLAAVCDRSEEKVLKSLADIGDIIICDDEAVSITSITALTVQHIPQTYRFSHDQLQRVAYSLLSQRERKEIHLAVGMKLKSMGEHKQSVSPTFEITDHLNIGADLIDSEIEKLNLAQLNLLAGQRALSTAASLAAFNYLMAGLNLLHPDSWESDYDLTLSLHVEALEAAYLSSNFKEAEKFFLTIIKSSKSLHDQARAYRIQIQALKARNMLPQAISTGVEVLEKFGVHLSTNPSKIQILYSFFSTRQLLSKKSYNEILNLPLANDPNVLKIMNFLYDIGAASYFANPAMLPVIAAKTVQLSLKHGNCSESSIVGYSVYGILECGSSLGSIEKGYKFGQLSLDIQKTLTAGCHSPQTHFLVNNQINHWREHLKNTLSPIGQAHKDCLKTGDFEIAAAAAASYSYRHFLSGYDLETTSRLMADYRETIKRLGHMVPLYRHQLFQQTVDNLRDISEDPTTLLGNHYSEHALVPLHQTANDNTTLFMVYTIKLLLNFLFQRYDEAHINALTAHNYIKGAAASIFVPLFSFYTALTLLARYKRSSTLQKISFRTQIFFILRKLRIWAVNCPENYLHKFYLVHAEKSRINNDHNEALKYYDLAILESEKNGYIQELALAHELTASYLLNRDHEQLAQPHLRSALYYYNKWGAVAKTKQIQKDYRHLVNQLEEESQGMLSDSPQPSTIMPINSTPDVAAVIKATRTLAEKLFEEDFLKSLMKIMLENAGAQRGFLLFETDNGWQAKLQGRLRNKGVKLDTLPPHKTPRLSRNIVNYVARTKGSVVLNNASGEGLFTQDIYILRNKPKSLICTPVILQGKISCIVYLENHLTIGAFPPERQEILHLLGSHAATSLKNSNLYSELEKTIEKLELEIKKREETQLQLHHAGKLAALGRLSSSIAHEFGNPLIGIRYLFQDLQQRLTLSPEDKKLIDIGIDECQRMKIFIRDMQQLNRPSSGKKSPISLHKTLNNILLFQKKNLQNSGINVVKKYGGNITRILAVEDQITQVLINITLNSVDAMAEKGGTLTIITSQDSEHLNIVIKDTGVGISPKNQENIFEPFFSNKQKVEGTGLGLPVSYSIIKNHGGNISFTSTPGKGSSFHIRLPNNQPESINITEEAFTALPSEDPLNQQ